MNLQASELEELKLLISDRIYLQVARWNLYLGDAGLAESLAIACNANLELGPRVAAQKALDSVQVQFGGGKTSIELAKLIPSGTVFELEEILDQFCR